MEGVSHIDDFEAIEAELKECLQELSNEELSAAENKVVDCQDHGTKEIVNLMAPESIPGGGRSPVTNYKGFNNRTPPGDQGMESEKVTQWRLAFQQRVLEKDLQEENAKKLWREKAVKDLDDFYKRRTDSMHRGASEVGEGTQNSEVGGLGDCKQKNIWERVAELCDFESKSKSVKDVSRMRSVIMSLKNSSEPIEGISPLGDPSLEQ